MAKALKIEHCVLDLRGEFKEKVMDYFAAEYLRGATPNPCVVCNREIKFGAMLKFALENGGDYVATGRSIGEVTFAIEPDGADLYINNTAVNYDKPISLQYGKYNVTVSLTGYETYTGVLDVEEASKTINIDLIEEVATASDDSSATATPSSSSASDSNDSDSETVTKQIDSDHTITVSAPEGAEVYLDNVYKGLAPCTFTKVIGSQTITLRETGYVTKSYSVDIIDDDKNAKLSFADLVKEEAD